MELNVLRAAKLYCLKVDVIYVKAAAGVGVSKGEDMLKIDNIEVFNFENAMRGMRNPKNSWDKNDTTEDFMSLDCIDFSNTNQISRILKINNNLCSFVTIGPNDLKLAQALIIGGSEHRKFLRQIFVSMDIDAPLYW